MDAATLARAQRGDAVAMEQVLAALAPAVHRFGMRMCRHADDADEVLQDTLLAIAQNLPSYEGRSSLTSWVFTLARTACARRRRGLKNRAFAREDDAPEAADGAPSPEEVAISRDLAGRINAAIDQLPEALREVIELRDVEGLSATEAAAALQITVEALKSRLHRARASLRDALHPVVSQAPECPDVVLALSRKLEGDLADSDCAAMEKHLDGCAACRGACDALRQALSMCRASTGPVPPAVQARVRAALAAWNPSPR